MLPVNKHTVLKEVRQNGFWQGYIAPNKVNDYHIKYGWSVGHIVRITIDREGQFTCFIPDNPVYAESLSFVIDRYKFWNCNSELGQRVRFWQE